MLNRFQKLLSSVLVLVVFISIFPQMMFAAGSSENKFLSFSVEGNPGVIDNDSHTISVIVPFRSATYNMLEHFEVSPGASVISHTSGETRSDYSSSPVVLTVVAEDGSQQPYAVTVTEGPSNLKAITSFSLSNPAITGFIDEEAFLIYLTVPEGTDVTQLTPSFATEGVRVEVSGDIQTSDVTAQDFTLPVTYTVVAADGSTRNYTVTVNTQQELSTAKDITYFAFPATSSIGYIDSEVYTVQIKVPFGTDLHSLVPAFTTTGSIVRVDDLQQISGEVAYDYIDFSSPVVYRVYDEAGDYRDYTINVQTANAEESSSKELLTFAVNGVVGTVNESAHTVSVVLPYGSALANQVATFTSSAESTVWIGNRIQTSDASLNDFTGPLTYTVYAENGTTQAYTVTVTVAPRRPTQPPVEPDPEPEVEPEPPVTPAAPYNSVVDAEKLKAYVKARIEMNQNNPASGAFSDAGGHWAASDIALFAKLGVISGYDDGTFRPNGSITRAEFAAIAARLFQLNAVAGGSAPALNDVQAHWAKDAIVALASKGILTGYTDGSFKPNQFITRAEMVSIIVRIVNLDAIEKQQDVAFNDIAGSWNENAIKAAAAAGLFEGRDANTFAPGAFSTRAEALTIILRVLNLDADMTSLLDELRN